MLAAISSACVGPRTTAPPTRRPGRCSACLRSLRGREDAALSLLAADDLGAARLMLTMVDGAEADRFTRNTLGPLLERGNRSIEELLETVRAFFDADRSVRNSAKHLGVHENTIRYRLGRVLELTGLDVATDSAAQLTVQVALLILKIQGRLPSAGVRPAWATPSAAARLCRAGRASSIHRRPASSVKWTSQTLR